MISRLYQKLALWGVGDSRHMHHQSSHPAKRSVVQSRRKSVKAVEGVQRWQQFRSMHQDKHHLYNSHGGEESHAAAYFYGPCMHPVH